MKKVFAIIPAGGSGTRIGSDTPKQFVKILDKELIAYTLEVFQKCGLVDEIIIAARPEYFKLLETIKSKFSIGKISKIIEGGKERQDSVFNALSSIAANDEDLIAVHDAARPLLPLSVLEHSIETAKQKGSAVVAVKSKDTLAHGSELIEEYIDRSNVYYVQTPQIFSYAALMSAMRNAYENKFSGTDESSLIRKNGGKVYISEGSSFNFKVTTTSDMDLFRQLIGKRDN